MREKGYANYRDMQTSDKSDRAGRSLSTDWNSDKEAKRVSTRKSKC